MPRSTIHYYARLGLLPPAQKTAASRSLYGQAHLEILQRILELKKAGRSLLEIRDVIEPDLRRTADSRDDLAHENSERIRQDILGTATEEFVANGYEKTHISTIAQKLGITHQVLYSHFPSKLALLVECFRTFMRWNVGHVERQVAGSPDTGDRLLWRMLADLRAGELSDDVQSHIHAERGHPADERLRLTERAWEDVVKAVKDELSSEVPSAAAACIPLELLAYSMIGSHRFTSARARSDQNWTREDVVKTHLWLWLVVTDALRRPEEMESRLARYETLLRETTSRTPESMPTPDSVSKPGPGEPTITDENPTLDHEAP